MDREEVIRFQREAHRILRRLLERQRRLGVLVNRQRALVGLKPVSVVPEDVERLVAEGDPTES